MTDIEYKTSPPTWQEYFQLFSSTGWMPILRISEDDLKRVFENTWYWITAYQNGSTVGCGRLLLDGALYALICDIIVMPDYQNKGIGNAILKQLGVVTEQLIHRFLINALIFKAIINN